MTPIERLRYEKMVEVARAKLKPVSEIKPMSEHFTDYEKEITDAQETSNKAKEEEGYFKIKQESLTNTFRAQQLEIVLNDRQNEALNLALSGKSMCIIGKAGVGKTVGTRKIVEELIRRGIIPPLQESTKFLHYGAPGVVIVSFTNRAVRNIAKGLPGDLAKNALTVHKTIEFEPEQYEIRDAEGNWITKMRFSPKRNRFNPLPSSIKCMVFEESSMISVELFKQLKDALPHECQMIFLGDLQQLPPVYGSAILGYKLLELPVVELTEIYRQAADSPIISFAWKIANGEKIECEYKDIEVEIKGKKVKQTVPHFDKYHVDGKLMIRPWKKRLDSEDALHTVCKLFNQMIDQKIYNPDDDMIMCPFNKAFGTIEINRNLAQYLGTKRGAEVFEIIAGFQKHYYAVGDKVFVEKQEAIVQEIVTNGRYHGVIPLTPAKNLNRWGFYNMDADSSSHVTETDEDALASVEDFLAASARNDSDDEETKQQASHILKARVIGTEDIVEISTAGEYSASGFSYALTVHKCQGSEWRKCFLVLHKSHAVMLSRELLYTAITRARESLYIICEPDSLVKGVQTQRIKGNTIAEKAEYFKGKLDQMTGM